VTGALKEISPGIRSEIWVFKTQIQNSLLRERLMATLSGFFGTLALLLACVGLYGILSYGVASRTSEIGLRMALGAQRSDVLWLVVREGLFLVLIGLAAGLPLVLIATQLVSTLLYGLSPADPASVGGAAVLMIVVAAGAAYFPARRATKVDPMVALRYE
jgi:ABC-type antimicrobial peptide transport system permease subunit